MAVHYTTNLGILGLLVSALALGCVAPVDAPLDAPTDVDGPVGGKADDFFSPTAQEYLVEGRIRVTLEEEYRDASDEDREARLHTLIGYRHLQLAYFLTQYLIEKQPRDAGAGWGGYGGMAKNGSYSEMDIRPLADGLTYSFRFQHVVAGGLDLLENLPLDDASELVLTIGNPSNEALAELETDQEWFRQAPWRGWDPASASDDQRMDVTLRFTPEEPQHDAWFDYPALFEDGVLTIDVHLGYDYHAQYHRVHARSLYLWLKNDLGFTSPVTAFDRLTRESGPFTSTIDANGTPVSVEVRLFWGRDGGANDPNTDAGGRVLEQDLRASMADSDVVLYVGHSGPFYGFSMANWKTTLEGEVNYGELESVTMAGRYQIVIADGCDTYQIASAFSRNPMTPEGRNVDVITTTSFGDAELPFSAMNTILHLIETDPNGSHRPRTVRSLLTDLTDANYTNPLYGIHFIDDNPTLHPYADVEMSCEPCRGHETCGAPGNRCVRVVDSGDGFCAAACTADDQCPSDYSCQLIAAPSAHAIYEMGCVPRDDLVCWWQ